MTADVFYEVGANSSQQITFPAGCKGLDISAQGAGGAGYSGIGGLGGGGGGRGGLIRVELSGSFGGKTIVATTGEGGYAPTMSSAGNIGTATTIAFDNGFTIIAGGGQRAIGQLGGCGGNAAEYGDFPSYVSGIGRTNLGSEIGQNASGIYGGIGAGNGDTGGGGNGGDSGVVGCEGNGGWIKITCKF